eukprot:1160676-Pelagomonas_calceolata.AAC.7
MASPVLVIWAVCPAAAPWLILRLIFVLGLHFICCVCLRDRLFNLLCKPHLLMLVHVHACRVQGRVLVREAMASAAVVVWAAAVCPAAAPERLVASFALAAPSAAMVGISGALSDVKLLVDVGWRRLIVVACFMTDLTLELGLVVDGMCAHLVDTADVSYHCWLAS